MAAIKHRVPQHIDVSVINPEKLRILGHWSFYNLLNFNF